MKKYTTKDEVKTTLIIGSNMTGEDYDYEKDSKCSEPILITLIDDDDSELLMGLNLQQAEKIAEHLLLVIDFLSR